MKGQAGRPNLWTTNFFGFWAQDHGPFSPGGFKTLGLRRRAGRGLWSARDTVQADL